MEKQEIYLTELENKQLKIINYYGSDNQIDILLEESAELVQAICKWKRYYKSENSIDSLGLLIEEMADVKNIIQQLELNNEFIKEGIERNIEYKIDRELDRIGGYVYANERT